MQLQTQVPRRDRSSAAAAAAVTATAIGAAQTGAVNGNARKKKTSNITDRFNKHSQQIKL